MELVESSKANSYYYKDSKGFLYLNDGKSQQSSNFVGHTIYFRCAEDSCKVRVLWRKGAPGQDVLEQHKSHNHEVRQRDLIVIEFRANLRRRARTEPIKTLRQIYNEEVALMQEEHPDVVLPQYKGAIANLLDRARKSKLKAKARKHVKDTNPNLDLQEFQDGGISHFNDNIEQIEPIFVDNSTERSQQPVITFTFQGVIAPVFVPYNSDMTLNFEVIPQYAEYLADNRIGGVLVNSEFGDGMILSLDERKRLTEAWISATKLLNLHSMVHVGGTNFNDVLELAAHAEQVEADSILCLPDPIHKPREVGELLRYLKLVASAAPKTALFYDHNPAISDVNNIPMAQLVTESFAKINSFRGLKYTWPDLSDASSLLKMHKDLVVFWGSDRMIASALFSGFRSVIASSLNVLPHLALGVHDNTVDSVDFEASKAYQEVLDRVCKIIDTFGDFSTVSKSLMNLYSPINVGKTARPGLNLNQKQLAHLDKKIKALDGE